MNSPSNTLQHSPADIVRQALIEVGPFSNRGFDYAALGTNPDDGLDWPIFASNEPDLPDNCITVYDTTGTDDGRTMDGELQEHMGWQVRVRSKDHNTGYRKINAIRVWVSEVAYNPTPTLDGIVYLIWAFTHIGDIRPLGLDSPNTKRSLFTLNGTIPVSQLTQTVFP